MKRIESNRSIKQRQVEKYVQIPDRPAAKMKVSRPRTTAPATRAGRREMLLPPPRDMDDGAGGNHALAVPPEIAATSMSMTLAPSLACRCARAVQAVDTKGEDDNLTTVELRCSRSRADDTDGLTFCGAPRLEIYRLFWWADALFLLEGSWWAMAARRPRLRSARQVSRAPASASAGGSDVESSAGGGTRPRTHAKRPRPRGSNYQATAYAPPGPRILPALCRAHKC